MKRNDMVKVFGKFWRVDYTDGSWLGISNDDNEHKVVGENVVVLISKYIVSTEYDIEEKRVEDFINLV